MIKTADSKIESNFNIVKIFKGSMISLLLTIIFIIIFSALLTYTSISERTMPTVIIIITGISILIGSQITTLYAKKNGILIGMAVGLIYIILLYLISSILKGNFGLNMYSIIMIVFSILAGGLGGIIGVNMKQNY